MPWQSFGGPPHRPPATLDKTRKRGIARAGIGLILALAVLVALKVAGLTTITGAQWVVAVVAAMAVQAFLWLVLQPEWDRAAQRPAEANSNRGGEELTLLLSAARRLSQSLDHRQIASYVVHAATEIFGVSMAWVGRVDPEGTVHILSQFPEQFVGSPHPLTLGDPGRQGHAGPAQAFRSGDPVVIHDLEKETNPPLWAVTDSDQGMFCCAAAFPLITLDRISGVLVMFSEEPGFFKPSRVEFFRGFAHLTSSALENARLFAEVESQLKQVELIRDIDMTVSGNTDLRTTLSLYIDKALALLDVDAGDILLFNKHSHMLEYAVGRGFRRPGLERTALRIGEDYAGRAALEGRMVQVSDLREAGHQFGRASLIQGEEFVAYYAVPLVGKGQASGVFEIFSRSRFEPSREWRTLLETVAGQASVAIDNAILLADLQQAHRDVTMAYDATLAGWSRAMDMRDKDTDGHTERVAEVTVKFARALGISEEDIVHIRRGALLHDIGRIGIPDAILLKPGGLTDEEWEVMRRHPVYAYELLAPIPFLRQAMEIPYGHHERWDGTGYPRGLRGEQIPLSARLFSIVDAWDALRSDRPFRKAWPEDMVRAYIREQAHAHFDPQLVDVFLDLDLKGY
jgi:HD-GYP domain-containing protein (c-di-GMP phosphodiesterase class II)